MVSTDTVTHGTCACRSARREGGRAARRERGKERER